MRSPALFQLQVEARSLVRVASNTGRNATGATYPVLSQFKCLG